MEEEISLPHQDSRNANYIPKDTAPYSGIGYRLGGDEQPPRRHQYQKFDDSFNIEISSK